MTHVRSARIKFTMVGFRNLVAALKRQRQQLAIAPNGQPIFSDARQTSRSSSSDSTRSRERCLAGGFRSAHGDDAIMSYSRPSNIFRTAARVWLAAPGAPRAMIRSSRSRTSRRVISWMLRVRHRPSTSPPRGCALVCLDQNEVGRRLRVGTKANETRSFKQGRTVVLLGMFGDKLPRYRLDRVSVGQLRVFCSQSVRPLSHAASSWQDQFL